MKLSLYVGETRDLDRSLEAIDDAERRGLHAAWLPGGLAYDTLTVLAIAAGRTERIRLGAGIAYAWPRHPLVLAQQALTLAAASDGRFELGIGTGHRRMMEETFGLPGIHRSSACSSTARSCVICSSTGEPRSRGVITASRRRSGSVHGRQCRSSSARSGSRCAAPQDTSRTES